MDSTKYDVLVIGAGLSGIGAAYRTQEGLPQYSYAVLESRYELGGTWSFFKYPGIRSDSDLFTFGFPWDPWREGELLLFRLVLFIYSPPNCDQDRAIATAPAIMKYLRDVSKRHGVDQHIKFNHKVVELDWQSDMQRWKVGVLVNGAEKRSYFARFVAVGSGYYDYEGSRIKFRRLSERA
jgi:cation diffusion facilitator CzcD-associated flavoprotein CzcO